MRNYLNIQKKGIIFFSTPFDIESAIFLNKIQRLFKISSGDNNFYPLINVLKSFVKPLIFSTGLLSHKEIKKLTYKLGIYKNKNKLGLLHCVSDYPAHNNDLNLSSICFLKKKFPEFNIGYSDHSLGIDSCKIAMMLGAFMIEKHFTLNKNTSSFHDHKISAEPKELLSLVNFSKNFIPMIGDFGKNPKRKELSNVKNLRRSAYFKRQMDNGTKIFSKDIVWLRPYKNSSIKNLKQIEGKKLNKNVKKNDLLTKESLNKCVA